jgi:hypothetical protein
MSQILGFAQMLGLMPGAQPQQSNPLAVMQQFFDMTSKMNELASQQNAQMLQGIQIATSVMGGAIRAGADPDAAAGAMAAAFKPKPPASPANAAKQISLSQNG